MKRKNNPENLNRPFIRRKIQMANKPMKRRLISSTKCKLSHNEIVQTALRPAKIASETNRIRGSRSIDHRYSHVFLAGKQISAPFQKTGWHELGDLSWKSPIPSHYTRRLIPRANLARACDCS